jgi:hypothetical protein
MKVKAFIKEFLLCLVLSALADAIVVTILRLDPRSNLLGDFIFILYLWFIGDNNFIIGILLFSLYYFIILYLVKNTGGWRFSSLMTLWAIVFIATVTIDDWNLSRLKTFGEYLRKGASWTMYSVVVAVVESVMGWIKMSRRMGAVSNEVNGEVHS